MKREGKRKQLRSIATRFGVALIVAATAVILVGCASTEPRALSMAHTIHSMTPCGMMMEAMMGNGHSGHSNNGAHHGGESDMGPQSDYARPDAN